MASVSVDFTWRDGALAPNLLFGSIPESIEAGCYLMRFEGKAANHEAPGHQGTHAPARSMRSPLEGKIVQARFEVEPAGWNDTGMTDVQSCRIKEPAPSGRGPRIPGRRPQRIALQRKRAGPGRNTAFGIKEIECELFAAGNAAGRQGFPRDEPCIRAE